ncbi:MAG: MMPL family transporter [Thermodesulfobacteriota bacterium]|jgi:predicted RND superfamily exporter protein
MNLTREGIFSWIARISCSRFRQLILGAMILAALSAFLITRLPFQSDVLNLLPGNAPATGAFVTFLKEFGSADSLFIVLQRKSGGEVESFEPFAEVLADRLMATGEFTEILGRMDPEIKEKMARQFLSKALLYLSEEDLKTLEARLSDQGIEHQVHLLKMRLSSMFTSPLTSYDPLDLFPLFRKNLPLSSPGGDLESSGYFVSADRKMILLIGKPRGSATDVDYDELLVRKIKAAELSAREAFAQKKNLPASALLNDLQTGLTGGFIHALEDSRMIKKELLLNFSSSLVGVLLLVVLAFRSGISLFYGFFPLLISPLLTLGLFCPFLGRLSEATGAFSAIILGLSIDFIILLYARYLEEKKADLDVPGALRKSLTSVGPGVFTGAVTTTAAYYALLISDFRGVKELGLLTGTGILVSLGCAFFLFPALVAWRERKRPEKTNRRTLSSFLGLERLGTFSIRHPLLVIILCAALSLGLLAWAFQVKLNNDPRRLRPVDHVSLALEMRVQEKMEEGMETIVVVAEKERAEDALEVQGNWKMNFEKGRSSGLPISRFETLSDFIPPLSQQKRNLEWIQSRGKEAFDPDRVEKKLRETLHKDGLRIGPFESGLRALRAMLANREMLTRERVEMTPLKKIEDRFLKKRGAASLTVAYLHIRPNFWSDPRAEKFLDNLQESVPGTRVTSPRLVQKELEGVMSRESWKILLLALAAVSLLVYLGFRSWPLTFICLLPVILASLWTLGLMGLFKIDLNFMNLVVFTMILGIGVDYGVYILYRGLESTSVRLETGLEQVSKGVLLAGLTTLWGFGSLVFSSYPGLRSMGTVALMGVGFSLLIALTLVPVLFRKWLQKRRPF